MYPVSSLIVRSTLRISRAMSTKVAVAQMQSTSDVEENFRKMQNLVVQAKGQGAQVP